MYRRRRNLPRAAGTFAVRNTLILPPGVTVMPRLLVSMVLAVFATFAPAARAETTKGNPEAALAIFKTHCFDCHGEEYKAEGFNVLDVDGMLKQRVDEMPFVTAGNPRKSAAFLRMARGDMPPRSVEARPTPDEIKVIETWITEGAVRPRVDGPSRKPIDELWILKRIFA